MASAAKACFRWLVGSDVCSDAPAWKGEGQFYERVPGVRRFVILNPYDQGRRLPPLRMIVVLKRGIEVRSETWAGLEAEVAAWLDRTEDRVLRNRVLSLSEEDEEAEGAEEVEDSRTPHRWRMMGMNAVHCQRDLPIECRMTPFCMDRKLPRQVIAFVLLTEIEEWKDAEPKGRRHPPDCPSPKGN